MSSDLRLQAIFKDDLIIPPVQNEAIIDPFSLFYTSEQYQQLVGIDSVDAMLIKGIHIWCEAGIVDRLLDNDRDTESIREVLEKVREYRISKGLVLALTEDDLIKWIGSKYARLFAHLDLSNADLIYQRIERSRIDPVDGYESFTPNQIFLQKRVQDFIRLIINRPGIYKEIIGRK